MIQLVIPGQPTVKGRPRKGAHGNFYTPRETLAHEESVAWEARRSGFHFPVDAKLRVCARFYTNVRKNSIPDLDNLLKALLDGLQKGELFRDDSQVVEIQALRFDSQDDPRTEVTVELF